MVNITLEIARKELLAYFTGKMTVIRNMIMLLIFCYVPITQIMSVVRENGYSSSALAGALDFYLLFSSFYALIMASSIAVMAFPYEKEQKTIEYLFTLPLSDIEIFAGKTLAAIVAGLAGLAFVMTVILGYVLVLNGHMIRWETPLPIVPLLLTISGIAPLIVVFSTLLVVAVSSYISSARMAYLPTYIIAGTVIGLSAIRMEPGVDALLVDMGIIAGLAIGIIIALTISLKTFNRERIAGS